MSVLEPDERQQIMHQARKAAEISWINYEALLGAGLPESLVEKLVFAWNLPSMDYTATNDAMAKMAALFESMKSEHDE